MRHACSFGGVSQHGKRLCRWDGCSVQTSKPGGSGQLTSRLPRCVVSFHIAVHLLAWHGCLGRRQRRKSVQTSNSSLTESRRVFKASIHYAPRYLDSLELVRPASSICPIASMGYGTANDALRCLSSTSSRGDAGLQSSVVISGCLPMIRAHILLVLYGDEVANIYTLETRMRKNTNKENACRLD